MQKTQNALRRKPFRLPEIPVTEAIRLSYMRAKYGLDGPTARLICRLAFGEAHHDER